MHKLNVEARLSPAPVDARPSLAFMAPSAPAHVVAGALFLAYASSALRKEIIIEAIPGGIMTMATGVDKGPFCTTVPVNFTQDLRAVGGTFIRTHDAQTIDWDVQFPFPLLDADPDDPSNYNFTLGDATMAGDLFGLSREVRWHRTNYHPDTSLQAAILDNGFVPYLRLGNSWNHPLWSAAPANLTALSRVLLNTVRHYNDGWGGGPFVGRQVRWLELWNVRKLLVGDSLLWAARSYAVHRRSPTGARGRISSGTFLLPPFTSSSMRRHD